MSLGPVMMGIAGTELDRQERELLVHPQVGGVILFHRNYESPEQLSMLCDEIHGLREPRLLIAVDQEGGRVQRFREGFTRLPAPARLGALYDRDRKRARRAAETLGWLMAAELRSAGVDFSFAPVLDLGHGISTVVGDRAFHKAPEVVADLAHAWMHGAREAGMASVAKHFPGHGGVREDSHTALPVDERAYEDLTVEDLVPFERMIHYGVPAVMAAHVIYSRVDARPAGFSPLWIREVLRGRLGFQGAVFSDDLGMDAAAWAGGFDDRARAAVEAGCDMVLVCNDMDGAVMAVQALEGYDNPASHIRFARLHGRRAPTPQALQRDPRWQRAVEVARALEDVLLDLDLDL